MRKLFVLGYPSEYGGAGSELRHQIHLWIKAFPELEINIIPTQTGHENEPLRPEMLSMGVKIHETPMDFSVIAPEDAIISFCSSKFLENLKEISQFTRRTMWVNCMTWLFKLEKRHARDNYIQFYLYQRPQVRDLHQKELAQRGATGQFLHFKPYFSEEGWSYGIKEQEKFHIGRISRQDADKFSKDTLHIYEYITSPRWKQGHFLGFDLRSQEKIGKPFDWINTYKDQKEFSVKDFYRSVDIIVQPSDTTENLPRIGFESMFSGKPLVVDDRGGWQHMLRHGVDGFLCKTPQEFIYWGTRLAFEYDLRAQIAENALERAKELASFESSTESWKHVFEQVYA